MKPSHNNIAHISAAGSGKTTYIVEKALECTYGKVLITTYTLENLEQIKRLLIKKASKIPEQIIAQTWFSFLLQEGVRPYQNQLIDRPRARSVHFQQMAPMFRKKNNYLTMKGDICSNKISEFVYECNRVSHGKVASRLEKIYSHVFIDEMQDLAGYDLDVLEMLFSADLAVEILGDPRQSTFSTNNSNKYRKYRKDRIYDWLKKEGVGLVELRERCDSFRCNQVICDFADNLYPEFPKTNSKNTESTGHDGVFLVTEECLGAYLEIFKPELLQHDRKTKTLGHTAKNIGLIKGLTYDRVLIFPTKPMLDYLRSRDLARVGDRSKLYVAITRARHSAAFVTPDRMNNPMNLPIWTSMQRADCI